MNKTRTSLSEIVEHISPWDAQEQADKVAVLAWIESGAQLYRLQPPDVPMQHLASYVVVIDHARQLVLLLDHIKANLWVPAGGHVEVGEDPREAAERELAEELGSRAAMVTTIASLPLFVTRTSTRGLGSHMDISLWYVVAGDQRMWLDPDRREFRGHRWLTFDEVLETDTGTLDPAMHRFIHKLRGRM